jgi:hypothetical protein
MTNEQAISIMTIQRPRIGTKEKLEAYDMAIEALEQKPCDDCISREALRQKLQKRHDFFVNAYGSFKDMPLNDKARVDEISSCIAEVVNAPSVTPQPKTGRWMHPYKLDIACECSECHIQMPITKSFNYCPNCGCRMVEPQESEVEARDESCD